MQNFEIFMTKVFLEQKCINFICIASQIFLHSDSLCLRSSQLFRNQKREKFLYLCKILILSLGKIFKGNQLCTHTSKFKTKAVFVLCLLYMHVGIHYENIVLLVSFIADCLVLLVSFFSDLFAVENNPLERKGQLL